MDLKAMAIQLAMQKLGGGDEGMIGNALSGLLGGGGNDDGFDLGGLVEQFSGGGLGDAVSSWLGDGDNDAVSAEQLAGALGNDKVSQFAEALGMDQNDAAGKLSELLPDLIDKSSSGGSLLDGLGGVAGLAGKLFR